MKTKILKTTLIISILFIGLSSFQNNDDKYFDISKYLKIFTSAFREVHMFYVDSVDSKKLIESGLEAMLKTLDPYTVYYPESDLDKVTLMTTGEYAGIGSVIAKRGIYTIIREPYKNSPADIAGLLPGDTILAINKISCLNKETDDVSALLKGETGKKMTIKVKRAFQNKPLDIDVIRKKIQIPAIPYYGMIDDKTGYIYLSSFTDKSAFDTKKAIIDLKERGAQNLVYDLRGNSGGLLDQAVEITNYFIPKDSKVVYTKGKAKQWDKEYFANKDAIAPNMPLIILIDGNSASAAEIVSGALQDYDRAVLIGNKSFGKGLVQTVRNLDFNTKIKLTTAKYYIPSGRCIQALDYSDKDGGATKTPDSLRNEFKTQNGRIVYDGGGIAPDITIEKERYSTFLAEIIIQDMAFDFVNEYALKNSTAPDITTFNLSNKLFSDFQNYLIKRDFKYESLSQKQLKKFIQISKDEKYYDISKEELNKLKNLLKHSIERDMELFKPQISAYLAELIIQRYHHTEGLIKYTLKDDKYIKKALELFENQNKLKEILGIKN